MTSPIRMTKKNTVFAILAFAICITWLREAGYVNLNLYQRQSLIGQASSSNSSSSDDEASAPQAMDPAKVTLASGVNQGVSGFIQEDLRSLSVPGGMDVAISQMDVDGAYWTPLYKHGTCSYEVRISRTAPKGSSVKQSSLRGTIDQTVVGICSIREYKKLLADAINQQIQNEASHHTSQS
jgi:hypothetical protein